MKDKDRKPRAKKLGRAKSKQFWASEKGQEILRAKRSVADWSRLDSWD